MADAASSAAGAPSAPAKPSGRQLRVNPSLHLTNEVTVGGDSFTHEPSEKRYSKNEASALTAERDPVSGLSLLTLVPEPAEA